MQKHDPAFKNIALIKRALEPLGYTFRDLNLHGERFTQFIHPSGKIWLTNTERIYYPFVSTGAKLLSKNKAYANELAILCGINLPKSIQVDTKSYKTLKSADVLADLQSVIVKPLDATLSQGLTTDIHDDKDLKSAVEYALTFSDHALIQEQVYGDDVRFIILQGRVLGVLLRQTPQIVGDGILTVCELIGQENEKRNKVDLPFDQYYRQLNEDTIDASFLQDKRVLKANEKLELSRQVLIRHGATVHNITSTIHPSYIQMAESFADNIGHGLVALDVMIRDYHLPMTSSNYWFLEFNSAPLLALLYCDRDGNHIDILSPLASLIDRAVTTS